MMDDEELIDLIKRNTKEGHHHIKYDKFKHHLIDYLFNEKMVKPEDLYSYSFNIPATRVNKCLKNIKQDLEDKRSKGTLTELEALYIYELEYAIERINKKTLYSSTNWQLDVMKGKLVDNNLLMEKNKRGSRRVSMRVGWMGKYSDLGNKMLDVNTLKLSKASSHR